MVEWEASTFPLVNLTKVSTAAHSTQCFGLQLFYNQKVAFWCLSFFNSKYLPGTVKGGAYLQPHARQSSKYSWRWRLTQLQWVFPLSGRL